MITIALAVSLLATPSDFDWRGAPGKTFTIVGVNGRISVKAATGGEAVVSARKTVQWGDFEATTTHVVTSDEGVTICTVAEGEEGCPHHSRGRRLARVDYEVALPKGVALVARTVNGEVVAEGLNSGVMAHSVNGSVRVSTNGPAEAETVNGSIHASLGVLPEGQTSFTTVNGSIDLEIPASAGGSFRVESVNGEISSDFPVTSVRGHVHRSIEGTLGPGSATLTLKTVNGSISLHRSR